MPAIEEPVHVVQYDANWPRSFAAERERLCAALRLASAQIEHIGSTAVPGLMAKPIVDLMLGVGVYPPSEPFINSIVAAGYESLGEAGVPERLCFRRRTDESFNLHVVGKAGSHWVSNLALREYLRSHADAKARYTEVKRSALASGATDLLAYSTAKAQVLEELLHQARVSRHDG